MDGTGDNNHIFDRFSDRLRSESESSCSSSFDYKLCSPESFLIPFEFGDFATNSNQTKQLYRNNVGYDEYGVKLEEANAKGLDGQNFSHVFRDIIAEREKQRLKKNARESWLHITKLVRNRARLDSWKEFRFNELPCENAKQHIYNALTRKWSVSTVSVKMETESFSRGALRKCYRLKKINNNSLVSDWSSDTSNYVAKCYIDSTDVNSKTYFDEVKLQMEAKLWAEEYNRKNPPKKIDIIQMTLLQFNERPDQPLYHLEHFIEGHYVKYNSNSGYVNYDNCRNTPQAFSHFTFERSGHDLIVVDIQGCGDLYTDPQIHTVTGKEFGDGNLGTKGMALFFHSHECNFICKGLGLTAFDLSINEEQDIVLSSCESSVNNVDSVRTMLVKSNNENNNGGLLQKVAVLKKFSCSNSDYHSMEDFSDGNEDDVLVGSNFINCSLRVRNMTECSDDSGVTPLSLFLECLEHKSRSTGLEAERIRLEELKNEKPITDEDSVLGQIHLDLAVYHELCRFNPDSDTVYDVNTALFHLKAAAIMCKNKVASVSLARLLLNLPHDILSQVGCAEGLAFGLTVADGLACLEQAGDRSSLFLLAKAYDEGWYGLNKDKTQALKFYERIIVLDQDNAISEDLENPPYLILGRAAEIYLESDDINTLAISAELFTLAADAAMASMKGKLANTYYLKAEEAYARCDM